MKIQHKIIGTSITIGIFIWIIDAVLEFFFFQEGPFLNVLIYGIHPHHLYLRLIPIGSFLIFGIILANVMALHKRTEHDLEHAHSDLNQVFNVSVPLCVIGKDFTMLKVNDTFCNLFGLKREDILGKKCHEIWNGPFCNTPTCPMKQILSGIEQSEHEVTKKLSDGNSISCVVTAVPYRSSTGELLGIVENFTNISALRQAEEELKKYHVHLEDMVKERTAQLITASEQLKQEIAERKQVEKILKIKDSAIASSINAVVLTDLEANIIYVNKSFLKMWGYDSEAEVLGKSGIRLGSDEKEIFMIIGILRDKGVWVGESLAKKKDGSTFFTQISAHLVIDESGKPICMMASFFDITNHKEAQDALRESELKYSTLVEQAYDGVVIVQDGGIKFCNKRLLEMTGYSDVELFETQFLEFIASESREKVSQMYEMRMGKEKLSNIYEFKIQCKDGQIKDVEASVAVIQYNGKPASMAIVREITERKRIEEELIKIEKLEAVGVLAGGIAHDFNNLLTVIIGNLSFAEVYVKKEDNLYEPLISAKKAASQTVLLTQQLLTFARGGAPIKGPASMVTLIKETASFCLRGSKVKCDCSLPDNLWPVEIDKGQISQVIHNLVINANQAMPEGGTISIRTENVTIGVNDGLPLKEGNYVKVSIKDQGIGIPKGYLKKIFDPYFTTKQEGSGLGLATTYSIIKNHGGHISVESELGSGTTFYIYLPAIEKEIFTVEHIAEESLPSGQGRILFMDDEQDVASTAKRIMVKLGYEVEIAKDGTEALELYRRAKEEGIPFDAVILDLTVPGGMGGKEAIQKLREIDPQIRAIVSSGYSNDPVMSEYRRYGFHGVVAKPYEAKELSKVLYRVIHSNEESLLKG